MKDLVKVVCENDRSEIIINKGATPEDVLHMLHLRNEHPFIAVYVNNRLRELYYQLYKPVTLRFIDVTHFEGMRIYQRTLFFILLKAVRDLYPGGTLRIEHSVARGFYGSVSGIGEMTAEVIAALRERMREIVRQDIPIVFEEVPIKEAIRLFREQGFEDKVTLLETRPHLYVNIYRLADVAGYFYGVLAPSTGYVTLFDIERYYRGFYLAVPKRDDPRQLEEMIPHEKMFGVFSQYHQWMEIMKISTIGSLNRMILEGGSSELIKIGEALQEKRLAAIADKICHKHLREGIKLVLISGPSSSGKTTFGKRLGIQLRVLGLKPIMLSMDNYFVNRGDTPKDEKGRPDYESLEAVDVKLLNDNLLALFRGEEVEVPKFDFHEGKRYYDGEKLRMDDKSLLIIEGIHGLNPALTPLVDDGSKFRVYVSALTSISMDNTSRIHTTDNRLLRRMVRDARYRNRSALDTLRGWGSVRRGEEKHIFPYQEQADEMFNSALFFELSILKSYAEPLLMNVPDTEPEYGEASRLLKLLDFFAPIDAAEVPPTSIIREFIGGSSFHY